MAKQAPRVILDGIKDMSGRNPTPVPESLPDSLGHFFILPERGDDTLRLVDGAVAGRIYGSSTFDQSSPFHTHQTQMAMTHMRNCPVMTEGIILPNAKKALLRLSAELIPAQIPVYARNPDGSIEYTGTGPSAVPVVDQTINGHRVVLHLGTEPFIGVAKEYGRANIVGTYRLGSVTSNGGAETLGVYKDNLDADVVGESILIPILDAEVWGTGKYGDRQGIRFRSPTTGDPQPIDGAIVNAIRTTLYRVSLVERDENALSYRTISTVSGLEHLDLALNPDVVRPRTNTALTLTERIPESYALNAPGFMDEPAPFAGVHVYQENLAMLLDKLANGQEIAGVTIQGEKDFDVDAAEFGRTLGFADPDNLYLLNFLSGYDVKGVPFYSFDVSMSADFGGVAINHDGVIYASGGADGLPLLPNGKVDRLATLRLFDGEVRKKLQFYGSGKNKVLDMARYPVRGYWDSGFSLDTKLAMGSVLSKRRDIYTMICTQALADWVGPESDPSNWVVRPPNTEEVDQAMALTLRTALLLTPESTVHGTGAVRAALWGHTARALGIGGRPRLPLIFDMADKVSKFMGAEKWKTNAAFDSGSNKLVSTMVDVSNTWMEPTSYDNAWSVGMNFIQYFDRQSLFYPKFATIYEDDTSVLKSVITMMGCCSLTTVLFNAWKRLTPTGRLTDGELIAESNRVIEEMVSDKYAGYFQIRPETFLSPFDIENGRTWSANINIYANNDRDTAFSTVIAHRMSDLT